LALYNFSLRSLIPARLSATFGYGDGVRVGWGVSEVQAAFVTTLAGCGRGIRTSQLHDSKPISDS